MRKPLITAAALLAIASPAPASPGLLEANCSECHNEEKAKGKFKLSLLGEAPTKENAKLWVTALDLVKTEEMPPEDGGELPAADRQRLARWLDQKIRNTGRASGESKRSAPRRLNNRELANSVSDVLLIEDVGTHQPVADLLGDTLHHGFDTDGDALGLSQFHLDQYINAFRKIIDATILTGEQRPVPKRYEIPPERIASLRLNQNTRRPIRHGKDGVFDFLDPKPLAHLIDFDTVPTTGRYKIKIRATGKDRLVYATEETGFYHGDPIRLDARMGDRVRTFELPDEKVIELELDEWLAAGTRFRLSHPTDAFRLRSNGNFKFQYAIAGEHLKATDPEEYARRAAAIKRGESKRSRRRAVTSWHHWTEDWQGARPRIFGVEIEGPIYDSWPPKRQVALLGNDPKAEDAAEILRPIAERAWRRDLRAHELDPIVNLVQNRARQLGDVEAFKEGIIAILVSPSFLLINPGAGEPADRFATKLSYFLKGTTPSSESRQRARGGRLDDFESVRDEIQRQFDGGEMEEFVHEFPYAWLQLDRINFMAPDPDLFRLYDRKRLSEDMVAEARQFFRHVIENDLPVTEFMDADYSFINADLAKVYGIEGVPQDSKLRRHTFADGRRGGLLGMGAFLTLTADSLGTSPIHRAVYVMENFLGIVPAPPPPGVEISEPDVRQAKTIKEILAAHTSEQSCATCHTSIDPYGYAFENFDPMGAWRSAYTMQIAKKPPRSELQKIKLEDQERAAEGLPPTAKPWENKPIPVDASARFRSGIEYRDITEFRQQMRSDANRDRFVRCFISKLLTYANGEAPDDYAEIERILSKSAENGYRIIDTIAAVVDSPLFREP